MACFILSSYGSSLPGSCQKSSGNPETYLMWVLPRIGNSNSSFFRTTQLSSESMTGSEYYMLFQNMMGIEGKCCSLQFYDV